MKKLKQFFRQIHLRLVLDIGMLAFETRSMYQRYELDTFELIVLQWKVYRWYGEFNLYKRRINE